MNGFILKIITKPTVFPSSVNFPLNEFRQETTLLQILWFDWQLHSDIDKFVANFGNLKRTSETVCQNYFKRHWNLVNWFLLVFKFMLNFCRFFVVGSRDMTSRIFSLFPMNGFLPVTLSGHRNTVIGCYFAQNSLDVSLLIAQSCVMYWWRWSLKKFKANCVYLEIVCFLRATKEACHLFLVNNTRFFPILSTFLRCPCFTN